MRSVPSEISTVADLLTRPEFQIGLVGGTILLALMTVLPIRDGRPGWGLAVTLATVVGVHVAIGERLGLVVAVFLMASGGWVLDRHQARLDPAKGSAGLRALGWTLIGLGSVLIVERSALPDTLWIRYWTPFAAVLGGVGLTHMELSSLRRYVGPLFLITATGIWLTVPDTREARILLGASIPLALATLPAMEGRITRAGAFALGGVVSWMATTGGAGRHASIVGAWTCMGIMLILPVALKLRSRPPAPRGASLFIAHAVLVLIASRIVGLWEEAALAAMVMVVVGASTLAMFTLIPSSVDSNRD